MCTAYTLDVSSPPLAYSISVRFSRFERLDRELRAELPQHLVVQLPTLPTKRGPFDPSKLQEMFANLPFVKKPPLPFEEGAPSPASAPPTDPTLTEDRVRGLNAYVQALMVLPGVATSAAIQDLVALSAPAEAAVKKAMEEAQEHDEARLSAVSELQRELNVSQSYVRSARAARERAEGRAESLASALDATSMMLARRRARSQVARLYREWCRACVMRTNRRHGKALARSEAQLDAAAQRTKQLQREREQMEGWLEEAMKDMREMEEREERAKVDHEAEILSLREEIETTKEQVRTVERRGVEEREVEAKRADAAASAASSARAQLRAAAREADVQRVDLAILLESVSEADEELAEAHHAAEARGHGSEALRAHVEGERRRRVVLNLRSALEQRASEARLLYLLKTQREALDAAAKELAAVRRAAAEEHPERPELEGSWLVRTPPKGSSSRSPRGTPRSPGDDPEEPEWLRSASRVVDRENSARRDEAVDAWRREWLQAMSHSM